MCCICCSLIKSLSWTAVLGNSRHRGEDSLFVSDTKLRDEKGSTTPLPAVFTETNPAATLKIRASTHAAVAETPMPVLSVKSFKKLPLWDFEGVYNQDAPPRDSVSMLRQDRTEKTSIDFVGVGKHGCCLTCVDFLFKTFKLSST